jgi:transcriptional regulator of arginine metabolism
MNKNPRRSAGSADPDGIARRQAIVALVGAGAIHSQAELQRRLRRRGHRATQATLSRDLKALGIGKVPGAGGAARYVLPGPARDLMDETRKRLEIEAFIQTVEIVGNLVLVRTPPGNAHGVGRALDLLGWPEIAGTVAGDDTILVVTRSAAAARSLRKRLSSAAGRTLR